MRIALLFDKTRPDTVGVYYARACRSLGLAYDHWWLRDVGRVPATYDLYLRVDHGDDYTVRLPDHLRPAVFIAVDTHLPHSWRKIQSAAPWYDQVFCAQREGARRQPGAVWLPLACDPEVHGGRGGPPVWDVAFVGTDGGVPGAASAAAAERQLPILGVLPKRGWKYVAPEFSFATDTATPDVVSPDGRACYVAVPPLFGESTWGDAAPMFVTIADAIVAIGGSWGTCVELALALKVNESRLRRGEPPIVVLPVGWFPGVADHLIRSPWMTIDLRRATFPDRDQLPASPQKCAEYLRARMRESRHRPATP